MTDEAKPPKKPASRARRPRKPATEGAKSPHKPAAKAEQPAATPAADPPVADPEGGVTAAPGEAAAQAGQEDAPTEVVGADEAATEVVPAAESPTEVLATDTAATQVMAAGAAPPPPGSPYTPVPRTLEKPGGGDRRTTLWVVLAVAAVAVVALLLVWLFVLGDNGEQFVGSWAPTSGEGGGLVITSQDGDFEVAMYGPDLELTGTYPATQDGDTLTFRFTDTQTQLGQVEATLTYEEDRDVLLLQLSAMGQEGTTMEFVRVDALVAASPSPTPSPTPTTSPTSTASPTASPTGSPSPTPSPTGTNTGQYDQQVVDAIVQIQVGVLNWSTENGSFPSVGRGDCGGRCRSVRVPVADERVHGPADGLGRPARRLHLRTAQRRPGVQAHRSPGRRPDLHRPLRGS